MFDDEVRGWTVVEEEEETAPPSVQGTLTADLTVTTPDSEEEIPEPQHRAVEEPPAAPVRQMYIRPRGT